jgi:uncharacterized protein
MKINLEQIPEDGLLLNFSGNEDILSPALAEMPKEQGLSIDPRVKGNIRIFKSGKDAVVTGEISGVIGLQCSRCLEQYAIEKSLELNLVVKMGDAERREGQDHEVGEDVFLIEGPEFDPGVVILQELILDVPMKPLCREDCPGLCPKCGQLKAPGRCACQEEEISDSRWAKLAVLKDRLSGPKEDV